MYQIISYKKHYKALFYLGIPIIIGQVGIIILGFADTLMIGHHSANELSAAGFVNNLFNLAIIFGLGFSYGLTPIVGALYGRKDYIHAGGSLKNSLVANLLIGVFLSIVMGILYLNLDKLDQPEELLPLIRPYFLTIWFSILFVMLFNGFKQFADGITDTRSAMWILLSGNVLNIAGNYILIYGKLGLPEMGITGAGISTLTSRILMVIAFVFLFFRSKHYAPYKEGFKQIRINLPDFKQLNKLGWPVALQMGMETASFSLCAIMLGWIGAAALAAHQIMCTIGSACFMVYYGMGAAVAVRVSNFKGQQDIPNLQRTAYAGLHLILLMGLISCTFIFVFRYQLSGWFTNSEEVNNLVIALILPMLLYQVGDGMQTNFANALRGIADVKPMMYIAFIAYIIISLPASYFFGFILEGGAVGIWMAFPFGLTSAGIMFFLRFRKQTAKMLSSCQMDINQHK